MCTQLKTNLLPMAGDKFRTFSLFRERNRKETERQFISLPFKGNFLNLKASREENAIMYSRTTF